LLSVSEALNKILSSLTPVGIEDVPLTQAAGRVLSNDITSSLDLPQFSNSSMDGFAVRAGDILEALPDQPITLSVIEDIPAGQFPKKKIGIGQTARIMTGAPIPDKSDAIIPIEDTDQYIEGTRSGTNLPTEIKVYRSVKPGVYIRNKGEDLSVGKVVLDSYSRLRPQDIGLLAMLGISRVSVFRRPRIVILSTGDELLPVEKPLQPGKIHDSNAYTLSALIYRDGGEAVYLGIVPDREHAVRDILEQAVSSNADLIISSAGVSVGAFDFVRSVVQSDGNLEFWRVNMRPGKPLTYGNFQGVSFIGLPGNPVSAFVGYEVFVRPSILKLSGVMIPSRTSIRVKVSQDIESDGRESYLRAIVRSQKGEMVATLTGHQGSENLLNST